MICLGRIRLTRLGLGACLTLLIHGLCVGQSAQAACGHLVGSRASHSSELSRLDPQILGDFAGSASADPIEATGVNPPSRPGRRFPCSGPSCSGNVPLPSVPGVLTADRLDQWGALSTLFGFSPAVPRMARPADSSPQPIGQSAPIFHPPRMIGSIVV